MINPLCKIALSALVPLLVAVPATAADLVPYDNGYLPEQYDRGPAGVYVPDSGSGPYAAEPDYCDPNGEPLADDGNGWHGECMPGHPYRGAVLPNGRYGPYSYQGSYGAGPPPPTIGPNDRYGDYSDQRGYRPAMPPSDRYGDYSAQPGYGPSRTPPAVAPDEYSAQRRYGPDRTARYGGYPAQDGDHSVQPSYRPGATSPLALTGENSTPNGYGPDRTARYGGYPAQGGNLSAQPSYRAGSTPPPAGTGENSNPNGYGPDRTARYGGYPPQGGYGPDHLPTPTAPGDYYQRDYDSGPPPYAIAPE